jgi:hypothetical protein
MKPIKLTQGLSALVDDDDFDSLNKHRWHAHRCKKTFYAERKIKQSTTGMHRVIMETPGGMEIDHIDGNGLNNQKSNLRHCTHSQNNMNGRKHKSNTTEFKGVFMQKRTRKWKAQIGYNHATKYLGCYDTAIEAAIAYNNAAVKYFGEFAKLNQVPK